MGVNARAHSVRYLTSVSHGLRRLAFPDQPHIGLCAACLHVAWLHASVLVRSEPVVCKVQNLMVLQAGRVGLLVHFIVVAQVVWAGVWALHISCFQVFRRVACETASKHCFPRWGTNHV